MEKNNFVFIFQILAAMFVNVRFFLGYDAVSMGDCISKFRGNLIFILKFNLSTTDALLY
jgi:hypothetical protein